MQKHYNYLDIDLDSKNYRRLSAMQGDIKSRYILVNLYSNNLAYDLSSCTVKIYGLKRDKTIFFNNAVITNEKVGQFEIELTNQALAVPGELKIQILILGTSGEKLTSSAFFIDVGESIIDENAIESTNEFGALTESLTKVNEWDKYFEETSGKIEEKYTERLNSVDSQIKDIPKQTYITDKATKEDLNTSKSNLQGQINALVVNGTGNSNPEVIQARVNVNGIEFGTLTERNLFVENTLNGSDFPITYNAWEEGGINTNTGIDTTVAGYLRTVGYLSFNGLSKITFNLTNCKVYVLEYSKSDKTFLKSTEKISSFNMTSLTNYFRIVIAPISNTGLVATNYLNMLGSYSFKEIDNLKNNVFDVPYIFDTTNKFIGGMSFKEKLKWEIGGINGALGTDVDIDYAVRSSFYTFDYKIEAISTKDMYCISYNQDGTFYSRINKVGDVITLTDISKKYRFVVSNGSGNPVTDINDLLKLITIKSKETFNENVLNIVNGSSPLFGKKINCLGDSITSVDYTLPTWWQQIANQTGCTFNNYGKSGTCVAYDADRESKFGKCFANRYSEMEKDVDGVIVMGGTNDFNNKLGTWNDNTNESFLGALNILMKGLIETYKGKVIIFMTPIQQASDYKVNVVDVLDIVKTGSGSSVSLQVRAEAIKRKCMQYGITCVDLYNTSGINGADSSKIYYRNDDEIHPSTYGQKVIANNLLPILEGKFTF